MMTHPGHLPPPPHNAPTAGGRRRARQARARRVQGAGEEIPDRVRVVDARGTVEPFRNKSVNCSRNLNCPLDYGGLSHANRPAKVHVLHRTADKNGSAPPVPDPHAPVSPSHLAPARCSARGSCRARAGPGRGRHRHVANDLKTAQAARQGYFPRDAASACDGSWRTTRRGGGFQSGPKDARQRAGGRQPAQAVFHRGQRTGYLVAAQGRRIHSPAEEANQSPPKKVTKQCSTWAPVVAWCRVIIGVTPWPQRARPTRGPRHRGRLTAPTPRRSHRTPDPASCHHRPRLRLAGRGGRQESRRSDDEDYYEGGDGDYDRRPPSPPRSTTTATPRRADEVLQWRGLIDMRWLNTPGPTAGTTGHRERRKDFQRYVNAKIRRPAVGGGTAAPAPSVAMARTPLSPTPRPSRLSAPPEPTPNPPAWP